jgi:hypothetical protein
MIRLIIHITANKKPNTKISLFRLKLSIESYLIDNGTNEKFDVAILRRTTIKDLKQIVRTNKMYNQ